MDILCVEISDLNMTLRKQEIDFTDQSLFSVGEGWLEEFLGRRGITGFLEKTEEISRRHRV